MTDNEVARQDEVLAALTRILRREATESAIVSTRSRVPTLCADGKVRYAERTETRVVEIPPKISDVNRAADLLGRRCGLWSERTEAAGSDVRIVDDVGAAGPEDGAAAERGGAGKRGSRGEDGAAEHDGAGKQGSRERGQRNGALRRSRKTGRPRRGRRSGAQREPEEAGSRAGGLNATERGGARKSREAARGRRGGVQQNQKKAGKPHPARTTQPERSRSQKTGRPRGGQRQQRSTAEPSRKGRGEDSAAERN